MELVIPIYLVIVNLTAFIAMGWDKRKAKKGAWRTPEKTLFLLAVLGGSPGAIAGMYTFRHKTKHIKFVIGMPTILLVQIIVAGVILFHWWG